MATSLTTAQHDQNIAKHLTFIDNDGEDYINVWCGKTSFTDEEKRDIRSCIRLNIYGDSPATTITQDLVQMVRNNMNDCQQAMIEKVTIIGAHAFDGFAAPAFSLTIPDTVTQIDEYAFANNSAFNHIVIPTTVKSFGYGCFSGCGSLKDIVFKEPSKITELPEACFQGCGALEGIYKTKPNSEEVVKNLTVTFYENSMGTEPANPYTATVNITFPDSLTKISNNVFQNCPSLGGTLHTNKVSSIGDYAFAGCRALDICFGGDLMTGDDIEGGTEEKPEIETERELVAPYKLWITSKRQFRYHHHVVPKDVINNIGYIIRLGEEFKFCNKESHLMIFKNSRLIPYNSVMLHGMIDTPVNEVSISLDVPVNTGDVIDIFYVTNDLNPIKNKVINGDMYRTPNGQEMKITGDLIDPESSEEHPSRYSYVRLTTPLYGYSSRESTLLFLNGRKIPASEIHDISDTILSLCSNIPDSSVNLEILSHLDTQDIIEHILINDGLQHLNENGHLIDSVVNPDFMKNTRGGQIEDIDLKELDSYNVKPKLDGILNDLSAEQLNKLFYDYYNPKNAPTTGNGEIHNENFVTRKSILESMIDRYGDKNKDWIKYF